MRTDDSECSPRERMQLFFGLTQEQSLQAVNDAPICKCSASYFLNYASAKALAYKNYGT